MQKLVDYVSQAIARIFSPNDAEPPTIGVQPFEGNPNTQPYT